MKDYVEDLQELETKIHAAASEYSFEVVFKPKRSRGAYRSISTGVTHGCGKTVRGGEPYYRAGSSPSQTESKTSQAGGQKPGAGKRAAGGAGDASY